MQCMHVEAPTEIPPVVLQSDTWIWQRRRSRINRTSRRTNRRSVSWMLSSVLLLATIERRIEPLDSLPVWLFLSGRPTLTRPLLMPHHIDRRPSVRYIPGLRLVLPKRSVSRGIGRGKYISFVGIILFDFDTNYFCGNYLEFCEREKKKLGDKIFSLIRIINAII